MVEVERIGAELAAIAARVAALPVVLDVSLVAAQHAALVDLAGYVASVKPADRGVVYDVLGTVEVGADGVRMRWRDEVRPFIGQRFRGALPR